MRSLSSIKAIAAATHLRYLRNTKQKDSRIKHWKQTSCERPKPRNEKPLGNRRLCQRRKPRRNGVSGYLNNLGE